MTAGWSSLRLRDVCELINGRAYKKQELLAHGKYLVLRVGNFFTSTSWYYSDLELQPEKYCDNGDLLYAWSASFGPRIWEGGRAIFHYHIWKVIPNLELIEKRYLYYFFVWDTEKIKQDQGAGATMLHVAKGSMEDRAVPVPSLNEQRRIIAILDEAFEGIATAKANAEKNLQNARELFELYHQAVFSGAGSVCKRLDEFASFRNGINYTKQSKGCRVRIIGVRDFQNHFWVPLDGLESVTLDGDLGASDVVRQGDLLVVRSNGNPELIGRCMVVGKTSEQMTHSGFTIRVMLDGDFASPEYICQYMRSRNVRRELIDGGNGLNIKSLNQGMLAAIVVPLPTIEKQKKIVSEIEAMSVETARLSDVSLRKLIALEELKKSLLHQAFTGQL